MIESFRVLIPVARKTAWEAVFRERTHEGRWLNVKIGTMQERVTPGAITKGS
jgi:hypothetical protein